MPQHQVMEAFLHSVHHKIKEHFHLKLSSITHLLRQKWDDLGYDGI